MKQRNGLMAVILSGAIVLSGCSSMSNAVKGGLIGSGAGAAVGAGVGALIGKNAKSAAIGAAIGTAVGATTGVIIGKKMDKAAAQAKAIEGARVDSIRDANNLKALKVTFDSGILFKTGKSTLNPAAQDALTKFAKILNDNPTMDIAIMGHTDNVGSLESNQKLSQDRAQAVADFLKSKNVSPTQFKEVSGKNFAEPVADNATAAGKAANRRVEVYMYASQKMIKEAEVK
ncbi:MAG: OmpA family protein [Paludibacter sp.]|jgi:outer membrane protein OmpA-like peptidoglycan-associated protein